MSGNFHKSTSGILATGIIGLIVISFMFGDYNLNKMASDTVAKVGPLQVKIADYQRELNAQLNQYSQYLGGKALTQAQIEQFRLKEMTTRRLIEGKLHLLLAQQLGFNPSRSELVSTIKNLPYFKVKDVFDLAAYKATLSANGYDPTSFEKSMEEDLKMRQLSSLLMNYPLSDNFVNDLEEFKSDKLQLNLVYFTEEQLTPFIEVSGQEVKDYLQAPSNKIKVETEFQKQKAQLDRPEQILASHILLREPEDKESKESNGEKVDLASKIAQIAKQVTPKNFKEMAEKYTEDPSGKNKGGSLGFFSRGQMVPEFEEVAFNQTPGTISAPVKTSFGYHLIYVQEKRPAIVATLEDHQLQIAKELLQKEKIELIKGLSSNLTREIKTAMEEKNSQKVSSLVKKYSLGQEDKQEINRLDGYKGEVSFSEEQLKELFAKRAGTFLFNSGNKIVIVQASLAPKRNKASSPSENTPDPQMDERQMLKRNQGFMVAKKFDEDLLKTLESKTKVVIYNNSIN